MGELLGRKAARPGGGRRARRRGKQTPQSSNKTRVRPGREGSARHKSLQKYKRQCEIKGKRRSRATKGTLKLDPGYWQRRESGRRGPQERLSYGAVVLLSDTPPRRNFLFYLWYQRPRRRPPVRRRGAECRPQWPGLRGRDGAARRYLTYASLFVALIERIPWKRRFS